MPTPVPTRPIVAGVAGVCEAERILGERELLREKGESSNERVTEDNMESCGTICTVLHG